jgi:Bacterial Ig domain/Bacterial Ig-like domain (group 1)
VTKSYRHRLVFPTALALAALTASCGGDVTLPNPGEAAELRIVDGNDQVGPVGAALAAPVRVRVLDTQDEPVGNHAVNFGIASGGGSVEPATATTDANGLATATWTLGPGAGAQKLRAHTTQGGSGSLLEVEFSATGVAGSGSVLVGVRGDDQTGPVNSALGDSLVVRATDALGNPVANVNVTWSVTGGGSISPVTVVTGTDGLAAAERVLGPTAGAQSAQAMVDGFFGSPVVFSHTAQPANPTALVLVSGDNQSAPAGFEVALDLVVRLEDPDQNGIGGRPITWVVPVGSGSVSPVSVQTDANGFARTRWTMPSTVGEHTVSAVFSGLAPVVFTATATADAPTTIEMVSGNGQSAPVGTAVTNPLVVRVTDASDNPVPNVPVAWVAVGGGSVSADNTPTDAQGLAQVNRTVGLVPGPYTTTASVDGLAGSPVTFVSTATVGAPAQLALIQEPGSPVVSGSTFSPAPQIEVRDAQGNPVPVGGIQVVATITSGQVGATLENDTRNTNVNGRVFFSALRISGPPDDDYILTFSASFSGSPLIPVSTGPIVVTAGGATRLVLTQQPSSSAQSGVAFAQQPVVQVVDATGNPVAGERTIQVVIGDGGGTLEGDATVSTGGGSTATFTDLAISGLVGSRTLIFSSGALTPVESNSINLTTGPAAEIEIQDGDGQTAVAGTAVATDPAVIIRDSGGNPVSGVEVTFTPSGGGVVGPQPVTTGSDGIASTSWTLDPVAGPNQLTAGSSVGTVTFNATGTASNVAPVANPDEVSLNEDGSLTVPAPGILGNDTDANGDPLSAQVVGGPPPNGDFAFNANGAFTYTPDADFFGTDQFTYRANDGDANSATSTVTITVNPINDDPAFTQGGDVQVTALEALAFSDQWATGIGPGPPNESAQGLTFDVTLNNPTDANAFLVPPQISDDGILSFTALALVLTEPRVIPLTVALSDDQGGSTAPVALTLTITP